MNSFAIILLSAIPLVFGMIVWTRWSIFGKRTPKPLEVTYREEGVSQLLSWDEFEKLMNMIAKCYSISAQKLRLDDSFWKELHYIDSWSLGGGSEDLTQFFTAKYPAVKIESIVTIRDMLVAIGDAKNVNGVRS